MLPKLTKSSQSNIKIKSSSSHQASIPTACKHIHVVIVLAKSLMRKSLHDYCVKHNSNQNLLANLGFEDDCLLFTCFSLNWKAIHATWTWSLKNCDLSWKKMNIKLFFKHYNLNPWEMRRIRSQQGGGRS